MAKHSAKDESTLPLMHAAARKPLTQWAIQAQHGCRESLGQVVAQLEPLIGSKAASACNGNSALKEDIEQHLRLRLIELVHKYNPHDYNEFLTYAYVFMSYDGYKVTKVENRYEPVEVNEEHKKWEHLRYDRDPDDLHIADEDLRMVMVRMGALEGVEKRVAKMHFWAGAKPRDIAKRCNLSVREVYSMIRELREYLKGYPGIGGANA